MKARWVWLLLAVLASGTPAEAQSVAEFYKGKQIQVVVGYGTGGGYDLAARVLSRHMGKHIPGNPNLIVQNMPGAGSLRAINYLYQAAPKDGTVFGIFARNMPLLAAAGGNGNVQFEADKFTWLGSSSTYAGDAYLLYLRKDANVKSLADARKKDGPPMVLGGTGQGSTGNDVPILLRDILGLNIKLIAGYKDANDLFIAVERKEIEGRITDYSSVRSQQPGWVGPNGSMNILLQFARSTRHPDYPNVPTAREVAPDARARQIIELAELPFTLSRPFAGPPGIPADRAKALREAFVTVHNDAEYLAEMDKLKLDVSPIFAADTLKLIDKVNKAPRDVLDYIGKLQAEQQAEGAKDAKGGKGG